MAIMNARLAIILLHIFFVSSEVVFKSHIQKRNVDKDPCIVNVGNSLLNLNNLYTTNGYEVKHEGRTFLLNICGITPACGRRQNISVCEIDPATRNVKHILGFHDTLRILSSYKPIPGLKYQTIGRKKSHVEIEFRCNKRITKHTIKYIPPPIVGKRYKFIFESKDVCVQHKMNCKVPLVHNNVQYDLHSLYNSSGNWKVHNTSEIIFLNMCGPLNQISARPYQNECSTDNTQVCLVYKNGVSKSLGSSSSDFIADENKASITFKDGSICDETNYIETQIDFFCSFEDENPKLQSASMCKYHIIWYTRAACPNYVTHGENCQIYDPIFGSRNIKTIFPNTDETKQINASLSVRYNLCDTLFLPCGYSNNASVCLQYDNSEIVAGWSNTNIVSTNGNMSMKLFGEKCSTGAESTTNINFLCSNTNSRKNDTIKLSTDLCTIHINVYTSLACIEKVEHDNMPCFATVDNHKYNLVPLISKSNNYEIVDPHDSNIIYAINICRPVVFNSNTMCNRYSTVCMRNMSEPNLTKRFKSLGNMAISSVPYFENESLMIHYQGGLCGLQNVTHSSIFTEIQFKCAQERKPFLLSNDGCHFRFEWRTPHACKN